jgi:hypothetical protein
MTKSAEKEEAYDQALEQCRTLDEIIFVMDQHCGSETVRVYLEGSSDSMERLEDAAAALTGAGKHRLAKLVLKAAPELILGTIRRAVSITGIIPGRPRYG